MSISVQPESTQGSSATTANAASASNDFSAAVDATPSLTVSGNSVDTGRYVITASRNYNAPDGGSHDDGMLKVFDKTNGSYVEAFGDPHLYTSGGTAAAFKHDGVVLQLADGTQIQIKPTEVANGVSHIDEVAITKNNQTVVQKGFYSDTGQGQVSTSAVKQGGASSAEGFNDSRDTALRVSSSGDLGTLVTYLGSKLNSHDLNASIDGLGGGYKAFADQSGIEALNAYSSAVTEQAAKGSEGPNAAEESSTRPLATAPASIGSDDPLTGGLSDSVSVPRSPVEGGVAVPDDLNAAGSKISTDIVPTADTSSVGNAASSTLAAPITPTVTDPASGISRDTIDALLAAANGTGPEVGYASYNQSSTDRATTTSAS